MNPTKSFTHSSDQKKHTCITTLRVVALLQSLQSSRHNIMNSLCCIFALTSDSTARAWLWINKYNTLKIQNQKPKFTITMLNHKFLFRTCNAWFFRPGAGAISPGVSIIVRFGQCLYSTLIIISLAENWNDSFSNLMFSDSMYACRIWFHPQSKRKFEREKTFAANN